MKHGSHIWFGIALVCSACAQQPDSDPLALRAQDDLVFLTQTAPATEHMQALFQGSITVDSAGCIRLGSEDQHTVVWPYGFTLQKRGSEQYVRAPDGREIGRIGGQFRFGGGEVPSLHPGIGVTDRDRAVQRCPGRFWIVGEV